MGLVPGFDAPTANMNTNAAMALFVFCYYNYVGLRNWGPGYIKHFMGPMLPLAPLMLPIEFVSHIARPVSLTLRLFGNIRGEEIVLLLFFSMAPIYATFPTYFLFLIAKTLQAFIFYMLTMIYLQGAMAHAHCSLRGRAVNSRVLQQPDNCCRTTRIPLGEWSFRPQHITQ